MEKSADCSSCSIVVSQPKFLSCGHVFCLSCTEEVNASSSCPFCPHGRQVGTVYEVKADETPVDPTVLQPINRVLTDNRVQTYVYHQETSNENQYHGEEHIKNLGQTQVVSEAFIEHANPQNVYSSVVIGESQRQDNYGGRSKGISRTYVRDEQSQIPKNQRSSGFDDGSAIQTYGDGHGWKTFESRLQETVSDSDRSEQHLEYGKNRTQTYIYSEEFDNLVNPYQYNPDNWSKGQHFGGMLNSSSTSNDSYGKSSEDNRTQTYIYSEEFDNLVKPNQYNPDNWNKGQYFGGDISNFSSSASNDSNWKSNRVESSQVESANNPRVMDSGPSVDNMTAVSYTDSDSVQSEHYSNAQNYQTSSTDSRNFHGGRVLSNLATQVRVIQAQGHYSGGEQVVHPEEELASVVTFSQRQPQGDGLAQTDAARTGLNDKRSNIVDNYDRQVYSDGSETMINSGLSEKHTSSDPLWKYEEKRIQNHAAVDGYVSQVGYSFDQTEALTDSTGRRKWNDGQQNIADNLDRQIYSEGSGNMIRSESFEQHTTSDPRWKNEGTRFQNYANVDNEVSLIATQDSGGDGLTDSAGRRRWNYGQENIADNLDRQVYSEDSGNMVHSKGFEENTTSDPRWKIEETRIQSYGNVGNGKVSLLQTQVSVGDVFNERETVTDSAGRKRWIEEQPSKSDNLDQQVYSEGSGDSIHYRRSEKHASSDPRWKFADTKVTKVQNYANVDSKVSTLGKKYLEIDENELKRMKAESFLENFEFHEGACQICVKRREVVECAHCDLDICKSCIISHKEDLEYCLKYHLEKNSTMINSRIKIIENIRSHSQNLYQAKAKLQAAIDDEASRLINKIKENESECMEIISDHFDLLLSKDSSSTQIFDYELTKICSENEQFEGALQSNNFLSFMRTNYPQSTPHQEANISFQPTELKPIYESLVHVFPSTRHIFVEHQIKMSNPGSDADTAAFKSVYDVFEKEKAHFDRTRSKSIESDVLPKVERRALFSDSDIDNKIQSIVHDMHNEIIDEDEPKPRLTRSKSFSESRKLVQKLRKTFSQLGIDKC